ncbi:MAG: hypothetical protein COA57_04910 [Flavobacteriales bacterium]|nr:MAG: hypothetical protein COA57_04910 [Flavobacteriales bacterium]
MLKNLTYKQRNIALAISTVLLSLMAYYMAIKNTVELAIQCNELEKETALAANAPQKIAVLKQQLKAIESKLGESGEFGGDMQQALLEKVSHYCSKNNLILKEFPKPVATEGRGYVVETTIFTVEGGFTKLLQLIYELEQKHRVGKVAAVHFQTEKDLRTKTLSLSASVYLQHIRKNDAS